MEANTLIYLGAYTLRQIHIHTQVNGFIQGGKQIGIGCALYVTWYCVYNNVQYLVYYMVHVFLKYPFD